MAMDYQFRNPEVAALAAQPDEARAASERRQEIPGLIIQQCEAIIARLTAKYPWRWWTVALVAAGGALELVSVIDVLLFFIGRHGLPQPFHNMAGAGTLALLGIVMVRWTRLGGLLIVAAWAWAAIAAWVYRPLGSVGFLLTLLALGLIVLWFRPRQRDVNRAKREIARLEKELAGLV